MSQVDAEAIPIYQKKDNFVQFERYLNESNLGDYMLRLPNNFFEGGSVGRSASLTQLIATWASSCDSPYLKSYIASKPLQNYEGFVSNLHGLSAVYFSDHMSGIDSDEDIRYEVLKMATSRIYAMYESNLANVSKGRNIELISVLKARKEFLLAFYQDSPSITDLVDRQRHGNLISTPQKMNFLYLNCLDSLNIPQNSKVSLTKFAQDELIGTILHEALRNTAEHAYLTTRGTIPKRGLRCIVFKFSTKFPTTGIFFKNWQTL